MNKTTKQFMLSDNYIFKIYGAYEWYNKTKPDNNIENKTEK